ncbi:hypothetical protein EFW57_01310 [Bacillus velezensis]|nr:hypothetical protein EFW57_01310 [Bacillus velezensis]
MNIKDSRPTGGLKLLYAKGLKNLKVFLADVKKGLESSSPLPVKLSLDPKDTKNAFFTFTFCFL